MSAPRLSSQARSLAEDHLPLVEQVLAGVAAHYPRHTDREELRQAAALGLVEAAARFDPGRGVPFDQWASRRIRGAILDAARALDFAPRTLRAAARDLEAARGALESLLGREPTPEELADAVGITGPDLVRLQGRLHRSLVLSLDAPCGQRDGTPVTLASSLVDDPERQPFEVLEERELATYVRDALACLPDRLRQIVVGYFLEGTTSAVLAARLGVTKSRVSQLRTEALALMRLVISARYDDGVKVPAMRRASEELVAVRAAG